MTTDTEWGQRLLEAVKNNDLYTLREAIRNSPGAVHAKCANLWTGLHYAANKGYGEVVKILLRAGADINAKNDQMLTPLYYATTSYNSDTKILVSKILLEWPDSKFDRNCVDKNGNSLLHQAAQIGDTDIVRLLLAGGADIYIKNKDQKTAFDKACNEECKALLRDAASGKRPTMAEAGPKLMTTQDKMMARAVARLKNPDNKGWGGR